MSSEDANGQTAAASASASTTETSSGGGDSGSGANRSIVVDAAFFEEQFLRCQVCQERFDETERSPKSLPCNHTFCVPCLTQILHHAQPQSRRNLLWAEETMEGPLKCPTCRVEIFVSKNKIKDLPNDHRVVQMMDFISQAVTTTKNVCTKHERQPLNFFCKKCLLPVCRDCTVLDHREAQGHAIVDVKQALSDRTGEFNTMEEKCRQTLEQMKGRSDSLANASKRLDILERQLRNEVKETFIEYRLLLEKRQEALTHDLQQRVRDQKALINTRFVHVCEHGTELQKLFDSFSKAKESNDVETLFNLHKEMKDQEEAFNTVAAADDNELFRSCTFDSTSEGEFLSGISSLGEVSSREDPMLKEPVSAHQLLYLDNEDRREREMLRQYELGGADDQDMEEPERDHDRDNDAYDDAYNVHDIMMGHHRGHGGGGHGGGHSDDHHSRAQQEREEDYELQRMLSAYRQRAMVDPRGGHRDRDRASREEMESEDPSSHHHPSSRPAHPSRRRPRPPGSSPATGNTPPSLAAQLAMFSPLVLGGAVSGGGGGGGGGDSSGSGGSNSRSGSRSRRRDGSSGGGGSGGGLRGYRVERHAHYPTQDDSN